MRLIESGVGKLEERRGELRPGVLKVLHGPFMEYGRVNRNERFYERSIMENRILNNIAIQEAMKNRCFFGEGDHPDRNQVMYSGVTHSVTELKLNDKDGILEGTIEILDTPVRRIIKTLSDYGAPIGISARASGDSTVREGVEYINEDSYELHAFDLVTQPGFARSLLTEGKISAKDQMFESIKSIVESLGEINSDVSIDHSDTMEETPSQVESSADAEKQLREENEKLKVELLGLSSKLERVEEKSSRTIRFLEENLRKTVHGVSRAKSEAQLAQKKLEEKVPILASRLLEKVSSHRITEGQLDQVKETMLQVQSENAELRESIIALTEALKVERDNHKKVVGMLKEQREARLRDQKAHAKATGEMRESKQKEREIFIPLEKPFLESSPTPVRVLTESKDFGQGTRKPNVGLLNSLMGAK